MAYIQTSKLHLTSTRKCYRWIEKREKYIYKRREAKIRGTFQEFDTDRQQAQVSHQSTKKSGHLETSYEVEALEPVIGIMWIKKHIKVLTCVA